MKSAARRKVNVFEMECLRSLVAVSQMDGVRNEELRWRAGIEGELESRADQRVLRWFGHVERMDEYRMTMQKGVDGRSQWRTGTKETEVRLNGWCEGGLSNRIITVEACAKDRKEWRALVHMQLNEFHEAIFAWHCVLSDRPPVLYSGYHLQMGRMPLCDAVGMNFNKGSTTENQGSGVKYVG